MVSRILKQLSILMTYWITLKDEIVSCFEFYTLVLFSQLFSVAPLGTGRGVGGKAKNTKSVVSQQIFILKAQK